MSSRLDRILQHVQPTTSNEISILKSAHTSSDDTTPSVLDIERRHASFPIRDMTYFLDGGKEITQVKEMVASTIMDDDILIDKNRYDISRNDARERTMAKIFTVVQMVRGGGMGGETTNEPGEKGLVEFKDAAAQAEDKSSSRAGVGKAFEDAFYGCLASLDSSWSIRIGVHYGLFAGAINGQGTDEQKKYYEKPIQEWRIIGCFAMTELGHGSYLQGLETTATYDKKTQEFVINSPTVTSTKWWIGLAGQTATHAAVYARLLIDGKDHGIQSFVVPIRDLKTGQAVRNVSVGDCGSKMGRNGLDNGWIQFHNKRIPRKDMLSRWAQVAADGTFTAPVSKQMTYNALIGTRVELFGACSEVIKKALTIAIRYGCVRKQFKSVVDVNGGEEQLLNYQSHQYKLFPLLAAAMALHFTATITHADCAAMTKDMNQGNVARLAEMHATSAGLKAFGTWYANDAIEICRQSLGGHGYSSYTTLASMRADWAVMCSWEGDNTVLALQSARFLIKQWRLGQEKKKPSGFCMYLVPDSSIPTKCPVKSASDWLNPDYQLLAFRHRATFRIATVGQLVYDDMIKKNISIDVASHHHLVDLITAARVHSTYYMLHCFITRVKQAPAKLQPVLKTLCSLFALCNIEETMGDFLEDGYLSGSQSAWLRSQVRSLLAAVRPDAIALVDSFNIPDFVLDSPLGRADGDVYNHYFEMVKNAPNSQGVPPYFAKYIQPLTDPDALQQ